MLLVYGLKNCDSCRKAMKLLGSARLVDVRAEGVPKDTLNSAYDKFGQALLNTRSTTWRDLPDTERTRPAVELLETYPTLMKRPLIDRDGELFLGWTRDVEAALG